MRQSDWMDTSPNYHSMKSKILLLKQVQKKTELQAACGEVDDVKIEDSKFSCTAVSLLENACASISLNSRSQNLLKCHDILIGDTGATQHSTFRSVGGTKKCECIVKT